MGTIPDWSSNIRFSHQSLAFSFLSSIVLVSSWRSTLSLEPFVQGVTKLLHSILRKEQKPMVLFPGSLNPTACVPIRTTIQVSHSGRDSVFRTMRELEGETKNRWRRPWRFVLTHYSSSSSLLIWALLDLELLSPFFLRWQHRTLYSESQRNRTTVIRISKYENEATIRRMPSRKARFAEQAGTLNYMSYMFTGLRFWVEWGAKTSC